MRFLARTLIFDTTRRLYRVLPETLRSRAAIVVGLLLVASFLELFGLAILIPLFSAVLEGGAAQVPVLAGIHRAMGSPSEVLFVAVLAAGVFALFVVKNLAGLGILRAQSRFSYAVYEHFAVGLHYELYTESIERVREQDSATLLRDINTAPLRFVNMLVLPLLQLLNEVAVLSLIVLGVIIYAPVAALLLAAVLLPTLAIFYFLVRRRTQLLGIRSFEVSAELNRGIHESVFGYEDVKLCSREGFFLRRFQRDAHEFGDVSVQQYVLRMAPAKILEVAMVMAICALLIYGVGAYDQRGELTLLLGVFALAAYRTLPCCNRIMSSILLVRGATHLFDVVERVKDLEVQMEALDDPGPALPFEKEIRLCDLGFSYAAASQPALQGVELAIRKGECLGIIGPSGSGKTTLLYILLRFLKETSGAIEVDDVPLAEANAKAWRRLIGYVSQDVFLLDGTVAENVAFGRTSVDAERLSRALELARLDELVAAHPDGVEAKFGERGARLSGGQRQRIAIARALYSGAAILFLDEATSALDGQTESEITESLRWLSDRGITIVIVAHRLSTLRNCDRIVELREGEVAATRSYEETIRHASDVDPGAARDHLLRDDATEPHQTSS